MLNIDLKDNMILLPDGETFPVNFGSAWMKNANKYFKKKMDDLVLEYFDKFILLKFRPNF